MDRRDVIMLGVGGGILAYFVLRRQSEEAAANAAAAQLQAAALASPSYAVASGAAGGVDSTGQRIATTGFAATGALAGTMIGGPIGTVIGAATGMLAGLFGSLFTPELPPDPVTSILIRPGTVDYSAHDLGPFDAPLYALDRFGYLYPLAAGAVVGGKSGSTPDRWRPTSGAGTGWLTREIIGVNAYVFAILPQKNTPISYREQLGQYAYPRPADAAHIRGIFDYDARFCLGTDLTVHGPWETEARSAQPIAGSPAAYAESATYHPTVTATPGEF